MIAYLQIIPSSGIIAGNKGGIIAGFQGGIIAGYRINKEQSQWDH